MNASATCTLPAVGIPYIACYLPDRLVSVEEWGRRNGHSQERIRSMLRNGVRCFHDARSEAPTDMAARAVRLLMVKGALHPDSVDLLIYTHTLQSSVAPPPASSAGLVQAACGLKKALGFSVSQQNCVSPMMALHVARSMMARNRSIRRAVIVTADRMGVATDPIRGILDLALHSDGACAFLVERDSARNQVLGYHFFTDGRFFQGTDENHEVVPDEKYHWSTFSTIRSALQRAGLQAQDIDRILPNHVNMEGWRLVLGMLKLPEERLFTRNVGPMGHVFGSDPFINLAHENKRPGGNYVLFSSGLAGCFGTLVLRH